MHPNIRCDRSRLRHSALKAFFAWRNGRAWRAFIISTPDFPVGYYADGDHTAQCEVLRDEPGNDLKFCEDATFWDRVDDAGGLQDRILLMSCDPGRREWNTVMGPLHDPVPAGALWVHRTRDATGRRLKFVIKLKSKHVLTCGTITGPLFANFDQMAHIFTTTQHRTLVFLPIDTRGLGLHSCIFLAPN